MSNTDKENEYKNAVLIRFRNKEKALKYFKDYNGQNQDTDLISLCNFDDPHSLKAELEKARELIVELNDEVKRTQIVGIEYGKMFDKKCEELEKAKELIKDCRFYVMISQNAPNINDAE